MPQSARAIAMFHAKQASSSRRRLVSVLVLFLSLLAQASWAQTVVNVSNGTDFATYMNASGNYTIRVTANFTMTNAFLEVPSGYTKTVVGWNTSTGATTTRTITRGGTSCAIDVYGTLNFQNININGGNHANNYSLITIYYGSVSLNNVEVYNCSAITNQAGCVLYGYYGTQMTTSGTVTIRNCKGSAPLELYYTAFSNTGTLNIYSNKYKATTTNAGGFHMYGGSGTNSGTMNIYSNETYLNCGGMLLNENSTFTNTGTINIYSNTARSYAGGLYVFGTLRNYGTLKVGVDGRNTAKYGAGVYVKGTMVCYSGSTTLIQNNEATINGGGIYVNGGSCTLANATISGNKAESGAGVFNDGTLRFQTSACTLSNNTATMLGGGLYHRTETVTFSVATTISNNTATEGGGGAFLEASATFPSYVTISGNNGGGAGGGVYVYGATMTVTGATITNNRAAEGGGIANDGTLSCTGTNTMTVTGNRATNGIGGGILNYASRTLNLSSSGTKTITGNTATGGGGGIYTQNGGTLTNCTIGASGAANSAANGGGVYLESGTLTVSGGSFAYNTASSNGGGFYLDGGTASFTGTAFTNNAATANGGGVYLKTGRTANFYGPTTNTMRIQNNTAGSFGGGVYIATNAIMGISGEVKVDGNITTRSANLMHTTQSDGAHYDDDVCLQTLDDNQSVGKIKLLAAIDNTHIGITEQQVASGSHRSEDLEGDIIRQFTVNYGNFATSKAFDKSVFFSNDKVLDVKLLLFDSPTTTGLLEVTLGKELFELTNWYVAGIVDDDGLIWGSDANSGLAPDVPKRTLTGPNGVFADSRFNPDEHHIFVVRAISAEEEAKVRLTDNKAVVRYPFTGANFGSNSYHVPDEAGDGSYEIVLHRYPGGHTLSAAFSGATDSSTTNEGSGQPYAQSGTTNDTRKPGPNLGPVFQMDDMSHEAKLYNIHMDGMREYSKEDGVGNAYIDEIDPNHTHNPSYLKISPESALLAVEAGSRTITLNENCDLLLNNNKNGSDNSGNAGPNNRREKRTGGAVYCAGTLICNETTLMKSKCLTNGGGIFVTGNGSVTMTDCTIGGGSADKNEAVNGGGIYINGGSMTVQNNSRITYNTATADGGGVYINADTELQLNGDTDAVSIQHNHATGHGGGVYKLGTLKVQGLINIEDNTAENE